VGENVSESVVLRNWALAECSNPERWQQLGQVVPAHLVERLRDELAVDEQEWTFLENIMWQFRSPLLDGLRPLQPQWQTAVLEVEDFRSIRIIRHQPFLHACPSGTLSELATVVNLGHAIGAAHSMWPLAKWRTHFTLAKRGAGLFSERRRKMSPGTL